MTVKDFVLKAQGVPFKYGGKDFSGWSCWSMLVMAYRECLGISLPDMDQCCDASYEEGRKVFDSLAVAYHEVEKANIGDVIVLRGEPCHVGFVVRPGWMLHVDKRLGTCVDSFERGVWKNRVIGIYRHAELA